MKMTKAKCGASNPASNAKPKMAGGGYPVRSLKEKPAMSKGGYAKKK
jgi:hypothetical protein